MGSCRSDSANTQNELPSQEKASPSANPFFQTGTQDANESIILNQYKFYSYYNDRYFGKCSVLECKQDGNLYLCKNLELQQSELSKKHQMLQRHMNSIKQENVIQIKQIIFKTSEGFFSESKKIIIIFDYPLVSLQHQLNNRIKKKLAFSAEDITNILLSTIRGYAAIQEAGFRNDKIRLKNIFSGINNKQTTLKVIASDLLQDLSNYQAVLRYGGNTNQTRDIYLAPEEFHAVHKEAPTFQSDRASVFSLGMSLLSLCLMSPSWEIYRYEDYIINQNQLKQRIAIVGRQYGAVIERFFKSMLCMQESQRCNFSELASKIPSILSLKLKQEGSSVRLSMIKSSNMAHVNNVRSRSLRNSRMDRSRSRSNTSNSRTSHYYQHRHPFSPLSSRQFASKLKPERQEDEDDFENVNEEYTNGNKYIGQKKNEMKHGKGTYICKDKSYYEGNWRNNKMDGKGTLYLPDGKVQYDGQWKQDEYNGWGTVYQHDSIRKQWVKYEGEFKNGIQQGRGKMEFRDGTVYIGQFRGGKIHGQGRKICKNGTVVNKFWEFVNPEEFLRV